MGCLANLFILRVKATFKSFALRQTAAFKRNLTTGIPGLAPGSPVHPPPHPPVSLCHSRKVAGILVLSSTETGWCHVLGDLRRPDVETVNG